MALTARDVQSALVKAISGSLDILGYCQDYFGLPHLVSGGGSGRQGQTESPAFAVVCWSRTAGEDDDRIAIEGSILLTIADDSIDTETTVEGIIVDTYGGPEKLETLLEFAAAEVLALSPEVTVSDLIYSFEPLEFFPLFVGGLDFTISFPRLIGGYQPTIS